MTDRELAHRFGIIAFAILAPFQIPKAGSLIAFKAVMASAACSERCSPRRSMAGCDAASFMDQGERSSWQLT
jgi:hypothetical protein